MINATAKSNIITAIRDELVPSGVDLVLLESESGSSVVTLEVDANAINAPAGTITLMSGAATFPPVGSQKTITHWGLHDGANLLYSKNLQSNLVLETNEEAEFAAGAFVLNFNVDPS
jgi:hypothetical protein